MKASLVVVPLAGLALLLVACAGHSIESAAAGGASGAGGTAGVAGGGAPSFGGCGGGMCGPSCTYDDIVGKAIITQITPIDDVCPDSQLASYVFVADDPSIPVDSYDPATYGVSASLQTVHVTKGHGLPQSCLEPSGITLNGELPMTRRLIKTGYCAPMEDVLDMDLSLCESQCP